jgi:hypothetical protein
VGQRLRSARFYSLRCIKLFRGDFYSLSCVGFKELRFTKSFLKSIPFSAFSGVSLMGLFRELDRSKGLRTIFSRSEDDRKDLASSGRTSSELVVVGTLDLLATLVMPDLLYLYN